MTKFIEFDNELLNVEQLVRMWKETHGKESESNKEFSVCISMVNSFYSYETYFCRKERNERYNELKKLLCGE